MRVLYVNPRAGGGDRLDELRRAAEARDIAVRDLDEPGEEASVIGVAGGDGSLAAVAQLALERDVPFVPVPLGTRNHFARDLGFDRDDPVGALAAFDGPERLVDVGTVNGRVFLNNVSLGVYAWAVRDPGYGKQRDRALRALLSALLRLRRSPLRLVFDGEDRSVLVLLVGNNEYRLASLADLANVGGRERLDAGLLHAYAIHRERLRLRFEERQDSAFRVEAAARSLKAALDGDPVELEAPLEFAIRPRALRVRILP